MKWISQLLDRVTGPTELGPPCVMRLTQNDVRMELFEYQLPCGHYGYRAELEYCLGDDDWIPIGSLRDFNVGAAIELLKQAQLAITRLQA